ncbi:MAG: hypothetical protein PUB84_05475 [Bacteroidales bacterium]|nr:hypothetical protein [Bacteroidales bacterium]MDD6500644.1 hypothetical protein [Bacteroidales bacterium]
MVRSSLALMTRHEQRPACGGVFRGAHDQARTRWQRSGLPLMMRRAQRPACGGVFYIIT